MKIFISYRRADSKYVVDRIRDRLIVAYGEQSVFRDIESIPLGKNFSTVLDSETNGCDVMLVIIGPQWAEITDAQGNKRLFDPADFTRIEIETGLKREGVLVIPALVMGMRLKNMPVVEDLPESLRGLTVRNATEIREDPDFDHDMQRLISNINETKGGPIYVRKEPFEPEMVYIPQGAFWMGSPEELQYPSHEKPRHEVVLPDYHIGKYPVKNTEYQEFVDQTGRLIPRIMGWKGQSVPDGKEDFPVLGVTWYDAMEYCGWLSNVTGTKYSLPNEAQWEKACRGPYDCSDLVGSVLQWTCTLWGEKRSAPDQKYRYPWKDDGRNTFKESTLLRVVRGIATPDEVDSRRYTARRGEDPKDPGFPDTRHSFRVIMTA